MTTSTRKLAKEKRVAARKRGKVEAAPPPPGPEPVIRDNPWGFTDSHVLKGMRYAQDVVAGRVEACEYVKQSCKRQLDDLERLPKEGRYHFSEQHASRVCDFLECLPHIEGPLANLPEEDPRRFLNLEPWQCFIVITVFGWRDNRTGGRRFRKVYIEVPRGNGKSALSSGIALYMLAADNEAGAQVYSAATTRHQARIVWRVAKNMMEKAHEFRKTLGLHLPRGEYGQITHPRTFSRFEALSRQAKNQDGLNIHAGIIDELHAHKTREVFDVVETGIAKRLSSMVWVITTAGQDGAGICMEVRGYVVRILERKVQDEMQFGIVYTIDKGDDWKSPATWRKANPNWGVSVEPESFESNFKKALETPAAQANFKTKHLDVWVQADQPWMDMDSWDACAEPALDIDQFLGQEAFAAVDLAARIDVACKFKLFARQLPNPKADPTKCRVCGHDEETHASADRMSKPLTQEELVAARSKGQRPTRACSEFRPEEPTVAHYYGFLDSFVPETKLEEDRTGNYRGWSESGHMTPTPGPVIDFATIESSALADNERHILKEVAYDPWQALQMAQDLEGAGIACVELRPNVQNFSAPMKEWQALVVQGRFHHDGNPVLRWMIGNVVCHYDQKDNTYPRKTSPEKKIDGAVAGIMAFNRALAATQGVYSGGRGFATL